MGYMSSDKRKNGDRPPVQWWLLGIGVAIGILIMLLVGALRTPSSDEVISGNSDGLEITATHLIQQATLTAENLIGTPDSGSQSEVNETATHIVEMATQTAQATP